MSRRSRSTIASVDALFATNTIALGSFYAKLPRFDTKLAEIKLDETLARLSSYDRQLLARLLYMTTKCVVTKRRQKAGRKLIENISFSAMNDIDGKSESDDPFL